MNEKALSQLANPKVHRAILAMALPAIVAMLVVSSYNLTNTLFISMLRSTEAIAAVSIVFPIFIMMSAVGTCFGVGGGTNVSRLLGAGRIEEASRVKTAMIFAFIAVSIVLIAVCQIWIDDLLRLLGASQGTLELARDYAIIIIWGMPLTVGNITMQNLVRAEGNSKYSMLAMLTSSIVNIALDPLMIFAFGLGVKGAAIATVAAEALSFSLYVYYYAKKSLVKITFTLSALKPKIFRETMKIGIPAMIRQMLICVSMAFLNAVMSFYGDAAVAGVGITTRTTSMGIMVLLGFTMGLQPVAGYNYGAGQMKRVSSTLKISQLMAMGFAVVFAALLFVFAAPIVGIFTRDAAAASVAVQLFQAFAASFVPVSIIMVIGAVYEGVGKAGGAFVLALSRQGVLLVPAVFLMNRLWGMRGLIWSQAVADGLTLVIAIVLLVLLQKGLNRSREVGAEMLATQE